MHDEDDAIANALGVNPLPTTITVRKNTPSTDLATDDEKFEEVRDNIKRLIDLGEMSYTELVAVAQSSQHPRAFEVLSSLLNNMVNANKQLLEIEKLKLEIAEKKGGPKENKIVNNNLFVGSTADILDKIKKDKT
jgi:hypothetical protein